MTKNTPYKKIASSAQAGLPGYEKALSIVLHFPIISFTLAVLEKTIFRTIPMLVALSATLAIGIFILITCLAFGYQIISLSFLVFPLMLGYIVGAVFEYIRYFVTQK